MAIAGAVTLAAALLLPVRFHALEERALLAAGKGSVVTLDTEGADEQECMDALVQLIEARFGESE